MRSLRIQKPEKTEKVGRKLAEKDVPMYANSRENETQEKFDAIRTRQSSESSSDSVSHTPRSGFLHTASNLPSQELSNDQTSCSEPTPPPASHSAEQDTVSAPDPSPIRNSVLSPFNEQNDDSITKSLSPVMAEEKLISSQPEGAEIRIDGDMLELGVVFDEYELIRFIGGGGMGNVWLAQDSNLNRLVALKVLHSDKSMNPEVIQRFYSEAQVAAMLNHPNISQIYAFRDHRESRRMFLTMEYVRGENLRDRVKNHGPMSVSETILIALQTAHALNHMAKQNIVHRDIKPSNILLTKEGEAKLIDLGLARISYSGQDGAMGFEHYVPNDITASGVTLGTFDYISPEQARDPRNVDTRSDIYSLGCTLFYLLTGHPPFPQGTPLQKLLQHQSDNPMDVSLSRIDVPESLNRILTRTMMKNPDERYAHPEELIADLEMAAQEVGIPLKNRLFTSPIAEPSAFSTISAGRTLQILFAQMCWIVPILFFGAGLWFLEKTWTPPLSDAELPPAPGIPVREASPSVPQAVPADTPTAKAPIPQSGEKIPSLPDGSGMPSAGVFPSVSSAPGAEIRPGSAPAAVPVAVPPTVPQPVPSPVNQPQIPGNGSDPGSAAPGASAAIPNAKEPEISGKEPTPAVLQDPAQPHTPHSSAMPAAAPNIPASVPETFPAAAPDPQAGTLPEEAPLPAPLLPRAGTR